MSGGYSTIWSDKFRLVIVIVSKAIKDEQDVTRAVGAYEYCNPSSREKHVAEVRREHVTADLGPLLILPVASGSLLTTMIPGQKLTTCSPPH
eukprot:49551-Eustigmatos_ZCMA.PRE.1